MPSGDGLCSKKCILKWILIGILLGGGGAYFVFGSGGGGGGSGSGAPKFRRIRFLNVSNKKVTKFKVSRVLPMASVLWDHTDSVAADGDTFNSPTIPDNDWDHLDRAQNDALANTRKVKVEIWYDNAGQETPLNAVELDTGSDSSLVMELTIVFDNHWNLLNDFQVTLLVGHGTDDTMAVTVLPTEAKRP